MDKQSILKNKKAAIPILIILALGLIIFAIGAGYVGTGSLIGSGDYIERPVFKYVKCEAVSGFKYSEWAPLESGGEWLIRPTITNRLEYNIQYANSALAQDRVVYWICNARVKDANSCRVQNRIEQLIGFGGTKYFTITTSGDEYVWLQFQRNYLLTGYKGSDAAKYQIGFTPYGLREYDVLSGSSKAVNPNDCTIPLYADSWVDRFLSSDSAKINAIISRNTNQRVLRPEELRWYVSGYVTSAAESFVLTYKGVNAWCRMTGTSAEIYKINSITLGSGSKKIASPDYSDYLGNEQCCPGATRGDEVCKDFKWIKIAGSECGIFKSCGSADYVPYSSGSVIRYSCVNGYCKSETKSVECASDYDCKDANKICDLNTYECKDANVNIKGEVLTPTPTNEADCENKNGKWITKTSDSKSGFFCLFGLGVCNVEVITTEYCDLSKPNYILYIGIALILVAVVVFSKPIYMSIRGGLKATPFGRLLP